MKKHAEDRAARLAARSLSPHQLARIAGGWWSPSSAGSGSAPVASTFLPIAIPPTI